MPPQRELSRELRWKVVRHSLIVPLILLVFVWAAYVAYTVFNFDLSRMKHVDKGPDSNGWAIVAVIIGTAVCLIWAIAQSAGNLEWARNGLVIIAKVTEITEIESGPGGINVSVYCTFDHNGHTHYKSVPILKSVAEKMTIGSPVHLLIDPSDPDEAVMFNEIFPVRREPPSDAC